MQIVDFTHAHIQEAAKLAIDNYNGEHSQVLALPKIDVVPNLSPFADNGLGVAAFENGKMVGFMCGRNPWDDAWEIKGLRNIFSPMCANATTKQNSSKIYAAMYQEVAEKWVNAKAVSHAICVYAYDKEAQEQFYRYGFGLRCMDAVRLMEPFDVTECIGYKFVELTEDEVQLLYPLDQMLNQHYHKSPFFMNRTPDTLQSFISESKAGNSRYFVAKTADTLCAYLTISATGETFIARGADYRHISGAYCLPKYRGKGVMQNLLNFAISKLKAEGYTRLGVDFESFNPTAYHFWLKYFTAYTHSVVRRIDENILEVRK